MKPSKLFFVLIPYILFSACRKETSNSTIHQPSEYSSEVAIEWINLERFLVRTTPGFTAPVAARVYAYTSLALYESVVAGIPENKSYSGLINGYQRTGIPVLETSASYNWELVVNACMSSVMKQFFKTASLSNLDSIFLLEKKYVDKNLSSDQTEILRSVNYGRQVADAIFNYAKSDGQENAHLNNFPDYNLPNSPWSWKSTNMNNHRPLQPYWGSVRPFLSVDTAYNPIFIPQDFSTDPASLYYSQANEVYNQSSNQDLETMNVVKFWNDEDGETSTPAGHSLSILTSILKNENENLAKAAEVYSRIGMALHDAYVASWKIKYTYNRIRPETYIKQYIDPNYTTLLETDPSPEFPCSHAVQIAAVVSAMDVLYGSNYSVTVSNDNKKMMVNAECQPRSFSTLYQLLYEQIHSRLLGGFNLWGSIELSIYQGNLIGRNFVYIDLKK